MSLSLLPDVLSKYTYNKYFIETGTFTGGGVIRALEAGFKFIHSIEIAPNYYESAVSAFANNENVTIHLGDSVKVLPDILSNIDEPITFFLDSHFFSASPRMYGGEKLSEIDVPLYQELDIIGSHNIKNHTILIDDRRVFGLSTIPGEPVFVDWTGISEARIKEKLLSINKDYEFYYIDTSNRKEDIFVAKAK
jgi:hypothetical protein